MKWFILFYSAIAAFIGLLLVLGFLNPHYKCVEERSAYENFGPTNP